MASCGAAGVNRIAASFVQPVNIMHLKPAGGGSTSGGKETDPWRSPRDRDGLNGPAMRRVITAFLSWAAPAISVGSMVAALGLVYGLTYASRLWLATRGPMDPRGAS